MTAVPTKAPNILLIIADQLSQSAVGAYGNRYGVTPNLDRLAARGARFTECYTPCPLCQPARAAFWTGRFPHETGVLSNGRQDLVPPVPASMPTLGELFAAAGYDAVHFGKTHDAGSLRGFRVEPERPEAVEPLGPWPVTADTLRDRDTTGRVVEYLREPPNGPFLAVADLNNPHNICEYVGAFAGPHADPQIPTGLPPLPDNFRVANFADLPRPVQYICCTHNRQAQAAGWTETNYRHYLAAYYHYVSRVDAEIGRILDALWATPAGRHTLVVFFADHGDSLAGRQLVTKQVSFYDETTRVPFIAAGPGVVNRSITGLCSLLDLLPTLTDVAGIEAPGGLWGRSLWPWLQNKRADTPHDYVVSEWFTEWGFTVEPGRMLRTPGWKYTRYCEGNGEELYDLTADPGEIRSLAVTGHAQLAEHRRLLDEHLAATADPFTTLAPKVDTRWRSHPPGYKFHKWPAAPMEAAKAAKGLKS
ncbi:MAG: sulfatase-like hydrolase/transferase [Verrucomicrobiota bacterium]